MRTNKDFILIEFSSKFVMGFYFFWIVYDKIKLKYFGINCILFNFMELLKQWIESMY